MSNSQPQQEATAELTGQDVHRRRVRSNHRDSPVAVPGIRLADVIVQYTPRKEMGDLAALARSIAAVGLLQPLVLTPGKILVFGHRRLAAMKQLNWESAPYVEVHDRFEALKVAEEQRLLDSTEGKELLMSEVGRFAQFIVELESGRFLQTGMGPPRGTSAQSHAEAHSALARIFGMGHTKLSQITSILAGADRGDPAGLAAVVEIDQTHRVDPAHRTYMANRQSHWRQSGANPPARKAITGEIEQEKLRPIINPPPPVEMTPADRRLKIKELAKKGYSSRQIAPMVGYARDDIVRRIAKQLGIKIPADAVIGKSKKHDSTKIVNETISGLEGTVMAINLVNFEDVDLDSLDYWLSSLKASMQSLTEFHKRMKELA